MNINELTIGQYREIAALLNQQQPQAQQQQLQPYVIGKHYQIRTVTMIYTGRIIDVGHQELVIDDACWIADTGRYADSLVNASKYNEVEPYPDGPVIIGRGAILDAVQIKPFTRSQK